MKDQETQRSISMVVKEIIKHNQDIWSFHLAPKEEGALENLSFIPGQVAVLSIPDVGESYFAIASAPEERGSLEFLIKRGRGVSEALFARGIGATVNMAGPLGKGYPVDSYRGRDLVLIGVGTAIAPLRSVIRSISFRREQFGRVALIYGARRAEDLCYIAEIDEWQQDSINVHIILSRPENGKWAGRVGYVSELLDEACRESRQPVALLCGMKKMIHETTEELLRMGVKREEILTNY